MIILYIICAILLIAIISYFGLWEIVFDIIFAICGSDSNSSSGGSGFGGGSSGGGGSSDDF